MRLKEILKGNVVAVGKNYKELNCEEIKLLLKLKCISNQNNYVVATNKNALLSLSKLDKRTFDKHFNSLIERSLISVDGDISKYCNIEIKQDEPFETFDVEFILDMLDDLTSAEIKLFCIMSKNLNFKENKNYIYPSLSVLVDEYYSKNELEGLDDNKIKNKTKNIDILKGKLIEKGYIVKIAAFRISESKSKLGYFLKTGKDEVIDYNTFVNKQLEKSKMKLATKSSLEKQKYKNLDRYIYSDYEYDATKKVSSEIENNYELPKIKVKEVEVHNEDNTDEIAMDYKKEFEDLFEHEELKFMKGHKKWDKLIKDYGYAVVNATLYDEYRNGSTLNTMNNLNDNPQLKANVFMKNKIEGALDEMKSIFKSQEYAKTRSAARIEDYSDMFDYVDEVAPVKNYPKTRSIMDIIKEVTTDNKKAGK